jgi:hypothetical protein
MAFTLVQSPDQPDQMIPMVVCDSCFGFVQWEAGYVLYGPEVEDHAPITSAATEEPGTRDVASVRVVCSEQCRDNELATEDEATLGYASLQAYMTSLTQGSGPIPVTPVTNKTPPSRMRHARRLG